MIIQIHQYTVDVLEFIVKNKIKNENVLLLATKTQKTEGETEVANSVPNSNSKDLNKIMTQIWKMVNSSVTSSRMTFIHAAADKEQNCKVKNAAVCWGLTSRYTQLCFMLLSGTL